MFGMNNQFFNNQSQQNNQQNFPTSNNQNSTNSTPSGNSGNIPIIYPDEPYENKMILNIAFAASSSEKVLLLVNYEVKIKKLLDAYIKKVQAPINATETLSFLFNAERIQLDEDGEKKVGELLKNNCTITVIDQGNVIGAKI